MLLLFQPVLIILCFQARCQSQQQKFPSNEVVPDQSDLILLQSESQEHPLIFLFPEVGDIGTFRTSKRIATSSGNFFISKYPFSGLRHRSRKSKSLRDPRQLISIFLLRQGSAKSLAFCKNHLAVPCSLKHRHRFRNFCKCSAQFV